MMTDTPCRRVLVTGGAGFIGSRLAAAYVRRGDQVVVLDDLSHGRRERVPRGAELMEMDIRDAAAAALVREGRFDVVNLHAAQVNVRVSVDHPREDASVNVDGTLNLLEAVLSAGRGRVVFASSGGAIYGNCRTRPTPETAAKRPESPYGVSKLTAEQYLFCFHQLHGLDYVALRYANVFGPGQDPRGEAGVAAIVADRLLHGHAVEVYGDGEQTRDYVYVDDVVSANLLMSDLALPRAASLDARAFNVGTGTETSVNRLVAAFVRAAARPATVEHGAARAGEVRRSCLRTDKLRALGWRPQMPFDAGVSATLASLREEASAGDRPPLAQAGAA